MAFTPRTLVPYDLLLVVVGVTRDAQIVDRNSSEGIWPVNRSRVLVDSYEERGSGPRGAFPHARGMRKYQAAVVCDG